MMGLSRRDVLICLSLADLSLVEIWRRIVFANRYLLPTWSWRDVVAAALVLLLLTAAFSAMVLLGRVPRLRRFAIHRWIFVPPLLVFTNLLRHQFPMWRNRLAEHEHLWAYAVVGALTAVLVLKRWGRGLGYLAELAALCALPFLPLAFAQSAWIVAHEPPPSHVAGRLPVRAGAPRFVWIVFDETDWRYVDPATRPAALQLPEFDRMMADSITSHDAIQAGLQTAGAIPTLIYGQGVEIGLFGNGGKLLTVDAEQDGTDWTRRPNIFSRIRARGLNTSVDGWYLPYCRIFASALSDCYWEAIDTRVRGFEPSLATSLGSELRSLSPLEERQRHLRRYERLRREALEDASDRSLNLVLLHMPVPHEPAIYDRKAGRLTLFNFRADWYLDNLALADRTLGDLRRAMEQAGVWDSTTVLVTSDHGLRWYAGWSEQSSPRIPYILKLAGQKQGRQYRNNFHTILTADLIDAVLSGEIRDSDQAVAWLAVHAQPRAGSPLQAVVQAGTSGPAQ